MNKVTMKIDNFSVSICVYGGDNPLWFDRALESISILQTRKPSEIVLTVDGPIPQEISLIIDKYKCVLPNLNIDFKILSFDENKGQGEARRKSVDACSYEFVALMDSDDVSVPSRFEEQLLAFESNDVDIVGGDISEFIGEESNVVSYRKMPKDDVGIKKYAKKRCPFNQVSVMFKKAAYCKSGGYIDWFQEEDYYLWIRMIENNCAFMNTGTVLVNVRVGEDMYQRRGGLQYYKSEKNFQKYMYKKKIISFPRYFINCFERFVVQVLMPNKLRGWFFKKIARSKTTE